MKDPIHIQKRKKPSLIRHHRRGMTLFEVIISITIVLAFMTALAGAFIGQMDAAKEETTKITMKRMDQALQIYAVKMEALN